jgi:hypothetical protein
MILRARIHVYIILSPALKRAEESYSMVLEVKVEVLLEWLLEVELGGFRFLGASVSWAVASHMVV